MIIRAEQVNFVIGDLEGNTDKIIASLQLASKEGVDLVVFSELSICGYIPKDMLEYDHFIDRCEDAIQRILPYTGEVAALLGAPTRSKLEAGKALYNSAVFLQKGRIAQVMHKGLLPTYDIFDEYRYFEPAKEFNILEFQGHRIAVTICEDLWNLDEPRLYGLTPMDQLIRQQPDLMINMSGSPYSYNHVEDRIERMQNNARHYGLPLIYVNQVGAHTEILFDGGSMFISAEGEILNRLKHFEEDRADYNRSLEKFSVPIKEEKDRDIEHIHNALVMGIRDYFQKMGFQKAVLGSSGGIDSAVVHALAAEALGAENVQALLLPSKYSSESSITDAQQLAENLGSPFEIISIQHAVDTFSNTLHPHFEGIAPNITEENIQARSRALILMAWSNKFGNILLNTSNKSESAVGYTTLYGDMCGGLSPIGDLYKTQVYEMARFINASQVIVPENILTKAPSAELRPDQKDSDSLPEYDLLDQILFHYIENELGIGDIIEAGYDEDLVKRIIKMIDQNEYKRFQSAPILRISHKAFGFGRQMPLVAKYPF